MKKAAPKAEPIVEEVAPQELPANGIHLVGWLNGEAIAVYQISLDSLVLDNQTAVKALVGESPSFVSAYLAEVLRIMMTPKPPVMPETPPEA